MITRVGRAVCFTVRGFFTDSDGRTALRLSRADAQRRCWEDYISHLRPGDVIPSCVTHLESFGAFVDIGCGTVALMTVDTMSVSRISHPRERLLPGERIWSVVKEISREGDSPRIYMSLRELLGTWEENAAMFSAAETVTGTVRSVENLRGFRGADTESLRTCGAAARGGDRQKLFGLHKEHHSRKDEDKANHHRFVGTG